MADVNLTASVIHSASADIRPKDEAAFDMIELLFFAYRDFVGDADEILSKFAFGRAHHRVLHFINRNPGMTVAEIAGHPEDLQAIARPGPEAAHR
jgi:hypothetical protein